MKCSWRCSKHQNFLGTNKALFEKAAWAKANVELAKMMRNKDLNDRDIERLSQALSAIARYA